MIKIYYMDTSQLNDMSLCDKLYLNTSPYRRDKIDSLKTANGKRLSLGAGALLDVFLSEYGLKERDMKYIIGEKGKPYYDFERLPSVSTLMNKSDKQTPFLKHFNLSHSHKIAMLACSDNEIGCDIEYVQSPNISIARRFFHPNEKEKIKADPDLFYRYWTLKESFIKQNGKGLSMKLSDFEVIPGDSSFDPARPRRDDECQILQATAAGSNKFLLEIKSFDGYRAAVCTEKADKINIIYVEM